MVLIACMLGAAFAALPISVEQQPETLISGPVVSGGFGGPVVKLTELAGQFAVLVGGRGGWIINHCFIIGGGGYALVNENVDLHPNPESLSGSDYVLEMGYGGVELEYVYRSMKLIHGSLQVLIGGGSAGYRDPFWDSTVDSDAFFVAEPGVNIELNISRPFRIDLGASYRFVSGLDLPGSQGLHDQDLRGVAGVITLKFGEF